MSFAPHRLLPALLLLAWTLPAGAAPGPLGPALADFTLSATLGFEELRQLGIRGIAGQPTDVRLGNITGEVLVVEVLNTLCYGCRQQMPTVNEAARLLRADPALAGKVRFVGLAAGNTPRQVETFRKEFDPAFPILPDSRFTLVDILGEDASTPRTIVLRRAGPSVEVVWDHPGTLTLAGELVAAVRAALSGVSLPADAATGRGDSFPPALSLSEEELLRRVVFMMERAGLAAIAPRAIAGPGRERLWAGSIAGASLLVVLVSRRPVCDVCHPVHFLLGLDSSGRVVDFDALEVTKYGNQPLNAPEIEQLRKRLRGRSVLEQQTFDPEVDAVSRATISSSLVIDAVGRLGPLFLGLKNDKLF